MNFTTEPPTTPGFYAWRINSNDTKVSVREIFYPVKDVAIDRGSDLQPKHVGGEWCRLVPAEEVEKAYSEGWDDRDYRTGMKATKSIWYEGSRAKQVAEGKL